MKMTKAEVFGIEKVLGSLLEVKLDPEVAFKVASNTILASEFVETIKKSYQAVKGYQEVIDNRNKLLVDIGATAQEDGSFSLPTEEAAGANEKIEAFNLEHKDLIDEQNEYQAKFDKMLGKETAIDFKIINRKELTAEIEPGKLVLMIKVGMLTDGDK